MIGQLGRGTMSPLTGLHSVLSRTSRNDISAAAILYVVGIIVDLQNINRQSFDSNSLIPIHEVRVCVFVSQLRATV